MDEKTGMKNSFMKWWHFDLSKRSSKEVSRSKGSEPRECTRDTKREVSGKKGWSVSRIQSYSSIKEKRSLHMVTGTP